MNLLKQSYFSKGSDDDDGGGDDGEITPGGDLSSEIISGPDPRESLKRNDGTLLEERVAENAPPAEELSSRFSSRALVDSLPLIYSKDCLVS